MRLHRLTATAFGPFAGTVEVDLDRLSEAGLFLLSGPTGAGKTSILDAICFAFYGDVPGDRSGARRLRCDQAAVGVRPEVTLEATLSGRRFRVVRSPAWERPKKRGAGTTTEQASVSIAERVDGSWVTLATRLDETGHLVGRLLGMNLGQFTQVAMLPQGRFQAFLRARSEDRQQLLQQLFRTSRFEDVERWLRDHRLVLRRRAEAAEEVVRDLVSRVSETTGEEPPDDGGPVLTWAAALSAAAAEEAASAVAASRAAGAAEGGARSALDEARALHERRRRVDAAAAELAELLGDSPEHDTTRERLDAARRAGGVVPLHDVATRARRAHAAAATAVAELADADADRLARTVRRSTEAAATLRAVRPRLDRRRAISRERSRLEARSSEVAAGVERARETAGRLVDELETQVARAVAAHRAARDHTLTAREAALDVRERRLLGMAAEMAGSLAVGDCCPVCGSCDHPVKAAPASDAPDEVAERAAQRAVDDAAATEHLRDVEARDVNTRLDAARARLDEVPAPLAAEAARVAAALEALDAEGVDLDAELAVTLGGPVDDAEQALADLEDRIGAHAAAERRARRALDALDALATATEALGHAEGDLAAATSEAGFAAPEEALGHALDRRTYAALAARADEHDRRLAAVRAVLAEPGAAEVAATEPPDLGPLADAHRAALDGLGAARTLEGRWTARRDRLAELGTALAAAVDRWEPLRRDLELATRVCSLVEGKSADNRLQMRLSAYVLGYRLGQVVAAANTRLALMSDQRYTLEHTGRRGAGETRGGLSLAVRDEWSGEARDPATLSGGETFVVSLALALGLADVVTAEAGGADLGTLFVDEGFGSLDADTLDDVLDVLDALRDGGRVVGVVSHVAEMRDRVPTQLLVGKGRTGSTVAVRG